MWMFTWLCVDFNMFVLTTNVLMSLCTCIIGSRLVFFFCFYFGVFCFFVLGFVFLIIFWSHIQEHVAKSAACS